MLELMADICLFLTVIIVYVTIFWLIYRVFMWLGGEIVRIVRKVERKRRLRERAKRGEFYK